MHSSTDFIKIGANVISSLALSRNINQIIYIGENDSELNSIAKYCSINQEIRVGFFPL